MQRLLESTLKDTTEDLVHVLLLILDSFVSEVINFWGRRGDKSLEARLLS